MYKRQLLKPAYQISLGTYFGNVYPAFLANDGNRTNAIWAGSCVTSQEEDAWWVVDLGIPMTVRFLLLTNHGRGYCEFFTLLSSLLE